VATRNLKSGTKDVQVDESSRGVPHRGNLGLNGRNGRINLSDSFIVQFYSTVLYDNFQNCSVNLWHNFMRQFYTRFLVLTTRSCTPFFMCFGF